ncbi:MAG: nuclear transport factor 2 family protein [Rhabdochlamydiaceae bacterium]|nr:nuclear transport factor 2 family protein [Rhabdochlamydiaceae bacterium]
MVMTLQEVSDRFEITDLLTAYCVAIDKKDIDALDRIFSHDARIDFSSAGGPCSDLKTIKNFLKENLGDLPRQHLISNFQFKIQGDHAQVRCLCHNPLELPPNGEEVMVWGLWYNDKCIRTKDGWRIQEKVTEQCYHWKLHKIP